MSFFHIIRLIIIFAILGNGINKKGIKEQPQKGVFIEAIWKSWHWNCSISIVLGIGIGIDIAKNLFLPAEMFFFEKIIFMFFIVLSYGISTTLLQILISLRFPIHSSKGIPLVFYKKTICLGKDCREQFFHCCFEKITVPKISAYFAYFPAKHPGWSSFYIHSQAFLGFSKMLFRAAIL